MTNAEYKKQEKELKKIINKNKNGLPRSGLNPGNPAANVNFFNSTSGSGETASIAFFEDYDKIDKLPFKVCRDKNKNIIIAKLLDGGYILYQRNDGVVPTSVDEKDIYFKTVQDAQNEIRKGPVKYKLILTAPNTKKVILAKKENAPTWICDKCQKEIYSNSKYNSPVDTDIYGTICQDCYHNLKDRGELNNLVESLSISEALEKLNK